MDLLIRNETPSDYRQVEVLTREAFWNVHVPGCDEHYLVYRMRSHPDFIPELDFVAISQGQIVGHIMYAKSHLINEENLVLNTVTFGPVSVLPDFQRKGIASVLIKHSIRKVIEDGYRAIVIEGHPYNYCKHGFVGSKSLNVSDSHGRYPYSLLVLELEAGCLKNHQWKFYPSNVYYIDKKDFSSYEQTFPPKEKGYQPSQEEFKIASNAFVE